MAAKKTLGQSVFPPYHAQNFCMYKGHVSLSLGNTSLTHGEHMEEHLADELVKIMNKNTASDYEEAFERAFELTKAYAGSANAQAAAIPFVFEKVFELFVSGRSKS
nr:hypothetical protein [uncultured Desulfobulbus sp.]